MMQISDVRIRQVRHSDGRLRAVASITIDDCFVVHDIRIFERDGAYFVAMPSRKASDGTYKDIAHPLNTETREYIQATILESFQSFLKESEAPEPVADESE